jgi:hypothetical protein
MKIDQEDFNRKAQHIIDTVVKPQVEKYERAKAIDKDIFNQATVAMEEMYGSGCDTEIDAYFRGAKWMQKQFKQQEQ